MLISSSTRRTTTSRLWGSALQLQLCQSSSEVTAQTAPSLNTEPYEPYEPPSFHRNGHWLTDVTDVFATARFFIASFKKFFHCFRGRQLIQFG